MTGNIVARRYAKALFALGEKKGKTELDAYGKDLAQLAEVLDQSPDVLGFFKNPVFSATEKKAVLEKILGKVSVQPLVKDFCDLLADKGRLSSLQDIADDFAIFLDEVQGVLRGKLVTAVDLSKDRKAELQAQLEKQTGSKVSLDYDVDKEILGGVVLKVGDKVLDASLRAQLEILKETIKRGE